MVNIEQEVEIYRHYQRSPIFFIEQVWGLVPQPVKIDSRDKVFALVKEGRFDEIEGDWFGTFVKGRHITWQQWLILLAIERALRGEAPPRITVASGHGIGKDALLAWVIEWYLFCFKDAQVPCTAPTSPQMHDILWKELMVWLERMQSPAVRAKFEWTTGYLRITESPETWFARARTASVDQPEALAGVHGEFILLVVDEASGVHDLVFKTSEGALTNPNVLVIMVSNPTRSAGYFYDSHHSDSPNWQCLVFDSRESPIVDITYVRRIADKYGEESDEFGFRVAGRFPRVDAVDDKGYVPLLAERDLRATNNGEMTGRIRLGIDPAGEGDNKTVWVVRDRFKAKVVLKETISNPMTIAQKTLMLMEKFELDPEDVYVDAFGVGGKVIRELDYATYRGKVGVQVNAVMLGDPPKDRKSYLNIRAEAYWRLRNWAIGGGELVSSEDWDELLTLKYRRELSSKLRIMSKQEMRKEGLKSPDIADALMLTFIFDDDWEAEYNDVSDDYHPLYDRIGV